ncbi:MAG: ATPase, T2SS/T4P/T4SS family, partial [Planctomycetota bacterium]
MADSRAGDHPLSDETACLRFMELVPHAYAREFLVLAVERDGHLTLLHAASTPGWIRHNVRVRLGAELASEAVGEAELAAVIDHSYKQSGGEIGIGSPCDPDDAGTTLSTQALARDADLLATGGKSEVAKFLDAVLFDAIERGASDLHIHPTETETLVRFRADGVLIDAHRLPRGSTESVISRLKVLGGMDTAETRAPQDGRATVTLGKRSSDGRAVDLRISTIPTEDGERAVIRVLDTDRGRRLADLDSIGMPADVRVAYEAVSGRPNGMVLLTGPTGSG